MTDLIYGGSEYKDEFIETFKEYPNFEIVDASDEVHEDRFQIKLDIDTKEYFKKMLLHGFYTLSLRMVGISDTDKDIIKNALTELKVSNPEIFR